MGIYGLTYSLYHPRGVGEGGEEKGGREREVWFVLFNDTWFQQGHLVRKFQDSLFQLHPFREIAYASFTFHSLLIIMVSLSDMGNPWGTRTFWFVWFNDTWFQ